MTEKIDGRTIRENAMRAGLILGGISAAYELIALLPGLVGGIPGALLGGLVFLLRIAKIVYIISLFKQLILLLAAEYEGVTRREGFRFGLLASFFSSLIVTGVSLLILQWLSPDVSAAFSEAMQEMQNTQGLPPESLEATERIVDWFSRNYALLSSLTTFFYCIVWGIVLTAIHVQHLPPRELKNEC